MRRLARAALAAAVTSALALAACTAAPRPLPELAHRLAPCSPGADRPVCHFWGATVDRVADGDTLYADIHGDGTAELRTVRVTGINAQEHSVYSRHAGRRRGECHALAATARFEELVAASGGRVRLVAQHPDSRSGRRLRRAVQVQLHGHWRDAASILLREGHAFWLPNRAEYVGNRAYRRAAKSAETKRLGLWDTGSCAPDPAQDARLELLVNWDAEGVDSENPNGEWVQIHNNGSEDVSLGGWTVRDSVQRLELPAGTVAPAGGSLTIRVGRGASTATTVFWGQNHSVFDNGSYDERFLGDGAYLFDPDGDLRYWMTYPCAGSCRDPLRGAVQVTAQPVGQEYVDVRNTSRARIDLAGHLVVSRPYSYPFPSREILAPGERLRIYTGRGRNSSRLRYWGKPGPVLDNGGDSVSVRRFDDVVVDCFAWAAGRC